MLQEIHVIDLNDYKKVVGLRPFVALPKEEIDRLFGSLEIHTLDQTQVNRDLQKLQLSIFTVVHFNYSWFTFNSQSNGHLRSLGFADLIHPGNFNGLFLDESLTCEAERIIRENITFQGGYSLRLAGLVYDESTVSSRSQLAVLYVVRLRQSNSIVAGKSVHDIIYFNNGELHLYRDQFDALSRIVIDHLVAL